MTASLCLVVMSLLRNLFLHRDSRCAHVSLPFLWDSVHLGYVYGTKRGFSLLFPIY